MKQCKRPHVYFTNEDLTEEEISTCNPLAVAVIEHGRKICKYCGYEKINLNQGEVK